MCYVGDSLNTSIAIASFARFDKNGNLISKNALTIPPFLNILANNNTLIHTNDGGFAYGASVGVDSVAYGIVILKYGHYGNFQWYKEIIDSNCLAFQCTALIQDSFSNYYIAGVVQPPQNPNSEYIDLAKTDSFGNIISTKIFEDTNFYVGTSGLYINGNHIVMGCGRAYIDPNNLSTEKDYLEIYELDSGLNVIKHVVGTDSGGHDAGLLHNTIDGGYMCISGPICYQSINTIKNRGSVLKLDSNFQVLWEIDIGTCSQNTNFNAIKKCVDGNWIAAGQWYDDMDTTATHINGWIMKYSESGQIIWNKLYKGVTGNGVNGDNNFFSSIAFLSDNSILCAGQALNNDGTVQPIQKGWLLHLDTAGCLPDSNSCGIADGIVNVPQVIGSVKAYPNPASDHLTIEYTLDGSASVLTLYNMLGQQMYSGSLPGGSGSETVSIRSWSPGLYLYRVSSAQGFEASGTFVVN